MTRKRQTEKIREEKAGHEIDGPTFRDASRT
jgi:hypothetical protein